MIYHFVNVSKKGFLKPFLLVVFTSIFFLILIDFIDNFDRFSEFCEIARIRTIKIEKYKSGDGD